jgi:branched-subunit amino acid aminotransferase/4-amino-4-deoxychorismate lyase
MTPEPQAYQNGRFVPASQAAIPVWDAGFVQGTTVAEQLRTFGGRLFRLDMHVKRLVHSLSIVEVQLGLSAAELADIATRLVAANHPLLAEGDDLGLAMFVTPGDYPAMVAPAPSRPTVCLHTFPLRFDLWAEKYVVGESLATTHIEQVPSTCWPPELKCRSRMHYYLADRAARRRHPGSRALLLDRQGYVVETTTANVVLFREDSGLVLPPSSKILPGISLAVLLELAEEWDIHTLERDLKPADVAGADEVYLTSTSPCMVPVVQLDGKPIGAGRPGPMFARFMSAWSDLVGLDIVGQVQRFGKR